MRASATARRFATLTTSRTVDRLRVFVSLILIRSILRFLLHRSSCFDIGLQSKLLTHFGEAN